ncbi:hypothetical protein [uncultured Gammaproteobacteria bacterium]|nr:hypothetical protein [uncultured Gammaproteobacteria bacterium]
MVFVIKNEHYSIKSNLPPLCCEFVGFIHHLTPSSAIRLSL